MSETKRKNFTGEFKAKLALEEDTKLIHTNNFNI